jgi:hypothetical protein
MAGMQGTHGRDKTNGFPFLFKPCDMLIDFPAIMKNFHGGCAHKYSFTVDVLKKNQGANIQKKIMPASAFLKHGVPDEDISLLYT